MHSVYKLNFLIIILFSFISCRDTVKIGNTEVDEELYLKKQTIDQAIVNNDYYSETLVKQVGKLGLVVVQHDNWPMEIDIIYNIWRTKDHQIKLISEAPLHANKGLNVVYENYYDDNGNTFAFVKTVEFFNINCSYDPIYDKEIKFYNENHEVESQINYILNEAKEELNPETCFNENPPELEYVIDNNLQETLARLNQEK